MPALLERESEIKKIEPIETEEIEIEEVEAIDEFPPKKTWTIEEYYHLSELGMLPERCELIYGEIYLKMTQESPHFVTVHAITDWLREAFGTAFVHAQFPINTALPRRKPSVPEPDAAVLNAPVRSFFGGRVQATNVVLIVEVSDSTLKYDSKTKAEIYGAAGIAEYWLIDVNQRQILAHRDPNANGYTTILTVEADEELAPIAQPNAKLRVSELFPPVDVQN